MPCYVHFIGPQLARANRIVARLRPSLPCTFRLLRIDFHEHLGLSPEKDADTASGRVKMQREKHNKSKKSQ